MNRQEERICTKCNKMFYVRGLRLQEAKTLSCFHCGERFIVNKKVQG